MAYYLSNMIRDAIQYLGSDAFEVRFATGGSTTTFIDTSLEDKYGDDELKDGSVLVLHDANGALIAPEGEMSRITGYVEADNIATITALTTAIAVGDTVMLISPEYPLRVLIELANSALRDCGEVSGINSTVTTLSGTTEYSLPATCKNLLAVYIQTKLNDTDDNKWTRLHGYRVLPTSGNVAATLVLPYETDAGYTLQFVYNGFHPTVTTYNSPINEAIAPPLATLMLADKIMSWYGVTDANREAANKILSELEAAKRMYPILRETKSPKYLHFGDNQSVDQVPSKITT